jgi:hypothetical protein
VDKLDDEGRFEFPSEDQMYSVLGLKKKMKLKNKRGKEDVMGVRMVQVPFRYFSTFQGRG